MKNGILIILVTERREWEEGWQEREGEERKEGNGGASYVKDRHAPASVPTGSVCGCGKESSMDKTHHPESTQ